MMTSPTFITTLRKINPNIFWNIKNIGAYLHPQKDTSFCSQDDFVAQLVEQLTLNQWAEGSSPSEVTKSKAGKLLKVFYFQEFFILTNSSNKFHRLASD